jgi:hypothetical protein
VVSSAEEEECTFGELYVSEVDSTTVHIFDLNGNFGVMTEEASIVFGGSKFVLDLSDLILELSSFAI